MFKLYFGCDKAKSGVNEQSKTCILDYRIASLPIIWQNNLKWGTTNKERLGDQHLFSQQKRGLKEDIIAAINSKMGGNSEDGASLFSEVHSDRMGGDRHMLQQRKVCQDKGTISIKRGGQTWGQGSSLSKELD